MGNLSKVNETDSVDSEISLLDIIGFFQESWKTIAGFTILGFICAVLFLWVVPKQYEATAQMRMAQIAIVNNSNNNINPLGSNIEEPQALIARMVLPTSYPKETIALCGLADQKDAEVVLASRVKLSIPKGVDGIVDLRIRATSKEIAEACTNAVFHLIKLSQAKLMTPYIDQASKRLKIAEERLSRATQFIAKADKSGKDLSAAYLATHDEIRYLVNQISNLQDITTGNESRAAHLTAPIYLKDQPVFPQKYDILMVGLLLGGLLGLVLGLVRNWFRSNCGALYTKRLKS